MHHRHVESPAITAPRRIPEIRPSADATDRIPIYFPRSESETMSVTMMLPTALMPPDPMPWNWSLSALITNDRTRITYHLRMKDHLPHEQQQATP